MLHNSTEDELAAPEKNEVGQVGKKVLRVGRTIFLPFSLFKSRL